MGSPIVANNLQIPQVSSRLVPPEGPKAIPVILDFTSVTSYSLDLTVQYDRQYISMIQTMFIDMSDPALNQLTIQTSNLGVQQLVAAPNTQGYYQAQVPSPARLTFSVPGTGGIARVLLLNTDIPGAVWKTV